MAQPPKLDLQPLDLQELDVSSPISPTPINQPETGGFLNRMYESVFNAPEFIMDPARRFAESVVNPSTSNVPLASLQGFIGGATEGAASLLSPANILTLGRGRIPQLASKVLGGADILHGGSEISQGNILEGLGDISFGALGLKSPSPKVKGKIDTSSLDLQPFIPSTPLVTPPVNLEAKPPTFLIRQAKATPETIKKAQEQGYKFVGLNDKGDFRFTKTQPVEQPILESDIEGIRPTATNAKLGEVTDVARPSPLVEAFNLPRSLMASGDFSAPLRQGLPLIHKKEFWTSLKPMFQSWANEDSFRASQDAIHQRPLFRPRVGVGGKEIPSFAEEAGLKLTDLTDLNKREEAIMSTWAERIPGIGKTVKRSNRAYTAFLNNLRADTFESLIKDSDVLGVGPNKNIPLTRALADFVNTATGRGSLGKLESSAVALNTMLFSPRLIASRLKLLNPAYYVMAPPQVRKEAIKSLFAIAAVGNTVGQLAKMGGGEVASDPNSSDFGKIKIGNTRIDPWGGFQQYIVAANRLLRPSSLEAGEGTETGIVPLDTMTGMIAGGGQKTVSSTSGNEYDLWNPTRPFDPTHFDIGEQFARGKLHPVLGFAYSLLKGQKELSGEPMNFGTINPFENAISQRFIPIVLQDIMETAKESPELLPITIPASTFGMGAQSYSPR